MQIGKPLPMLGLLVLSPCCLQTIITLQCYHVTIENLDLSMLDHLKEIRISLKALPKGLVLKSSGCKDWGIGYLGIPCKPHTTKVTSVSHCSMVVHHRSWFITMYEVLFPQVVPLRVVMFDQFRLIRLAVREGIVGWQS